MDQAAAKQQIVEKIKQANNILVTVSSNPSVDQLAACIGMALFLNKLDKHATAVFSGKAPSTIEFLQPEKTLESNTDSLRDFIISLDKAKADKLRYKVEDQYVRIYISPYKTSISQKDLVFSEGDFNVDVVLALGVHEKAQLDAAIATHGRILHDASVISVNAGKSNAPSLGQINWQDEGASSLCEMLVSISEAFGTGLIDNQMATAFLTGIVAETERFSNKKTSPKVMTMSAQLMAAGANQQLIVEKLEPPQAPPEAGQPAEPKAPEPKPSPPDTLNIPHDEDKEPVPKPEEKSEVQINPSQIKIDERGNIVDKTQTPTPPQPKPEPEPEVVQPQPVEPPLPPAPAPPPPPAPAFHEPRVIEPTVVPAVPQPAPAVSYEMPPYEITPIKDLHAGAAPISMPAEPVKTEDILPPKPESAGPPKPHTFIDSANNNHVPPLSADTEVGNRSQDTTTPLDPLNESSMMGDSLLGHTRSAGTVTGEKVVQPPVGLPVPPPSDPSTPTFPTPEVDNARDAVQSAIAAAPFDPAAEGPVASLNAQPVNFEAPPQPNGDLGVSHSGASNSVFDTTGPAPPPVPPPLKLDSGAVIPTTVGAPK